MSLLLKFLAWCFGLNRPPIQASHCPNFVEDGKEWLDDPDEITNARWYAEHCYSLPTAKK